MLPDKFQHILRVLNTNIDGKQKIMFGLTSIKVPNTSDECIRCLCVLLKGSGVKFACMCLCIGCGSSLRQFGMQKSRH